MTGLSSAMESAPPVEPVRGACGFSPYGLCYMSSTTTRFARTGRRVEQARGDGEWCVDRGEPCLVVPLAPFAEQRQRLDEPLCLDEMASCGDG